MDTVWLVSKVLGTGLLWALIIFLIVFAVHWVRRQKAQADGGPESAKAVAAHTRPGDMTRRIIEEIRAAPRR